MPRSLGQKFVYSAVNPNVRIPVIKDALDLLYQAKVCHRVTASSANGVPLGAELLSQYIKVIIIDVGLCSADLGLSLAELGSSTSNKLMLFFKKNLHSFLSCFLLVLIRGCCIDEEMIAFELWCELNDILLI